MTMVVVLLGSLNIPFFLYMERELKNIKESIRKAATGAAMFTSVCVAMVGIIPDETYPVFFIVFPCIQLLVQGLPPPPEETPSHIWIVAP